MQMEFRKADIHAAILIFRMYGCSRDEKYSYLKYLPRRGHVYLKLEKSWQEKVDTSSKPNEI